MKIAVIGSGISGLSAAWLLDQKHETTLYEAADYLGGHTNTVDITVDGITHPVDTGFLVHNDLTYPNLIKLFEHLGVETHSTDMSFSVQLPGVNIEWAGTDINTVFGQRRNLFRPSFWRMLKEILHFNAQANALLLQAERNAVSLGHLLKIEGYSNYLRDWYLLPMAAAIWSSSPKDILDFPAATFLRFCINHRLLQVNDRPQWKSIIGGGRNYVEKMAQSINVQLNSPVDQITRSHNKVTVESNGKKADFDSVVLATHAPESLQMLQDASADEQTILGSIRYQPNKAILHTDKRFLPKNKSIWSAWNYLSSDDDDESVCVTYLLNKLQQLPFETPVMVTLNPPPGLTPQNIIREFNYEHPIFDQSAVDAQRSLDKIQGVNHTWFCGAWAGYGFHEDGLKSALNIVGDFGVEAPWKASL